MGALFAVSLTFFGASYDIIVVLLLLSLLPFHDVAEILFCKTIHLFKEPHILPEIDFSRGIPDDFRTLIVYASLIANKDSAARTLACMESTHLTNRDINLPVAILTHFGDSFEAAVTEDEGNLLDFVLSGIHSLNEKHGHGQFFLFHRDRTWNTVSRKWTGWERKRGGVEKLNKWLLGKIEGEEYREWGSDKTFSVTAGDTASVGNISKVILLDSDNILSDGYARRLVGMAAHPLNQPVIDEETDIVVKGYGVLQPFPIPSKDSCGRSFYARMEGWHRRPDGAHHYILQSLQDLLHEGTYIGKGIYDVATHERVLSHRFPENQLLSHDKVESGFLRAALVQNVFVQEEAVDNFLGGISQIERWLRGDKQVLAWVLPKIPNSKREYVRNPLSAFSRWNLMWPIKKQLSIPSLVILCAVGWFVPQFPTWLCSLILIGVVGFSYLIVPVKLKSPGSSAVGIVRGIVSTIIYLSFYLHRALSILEAWVRITLQIPEGTYLADSLDKVKRDPGLSSYGKFKKILCILVTSILRKPNIDWVTASEVKIKKEIYSLTGICRTMLPSIVVSLILGLGCLVFVEGVMYVLPIIGLWLAAPLIVYAISG